jgi:hypothetical protein
MRRDNQVSKSNSETVTDNLALAIASMVDAAQSSLAKQVLDEISTMAGGTHGGGLVVVSRDAAVERLRELFARLEIDVSEGEVKP